MPEKLYSIKESAMVNMADTIRQITGTTGPITGEEIGNYVVTNLPNSENLDEVLEDQDDIIAQIQTALEGKASAAPTLQEKTVTPSTSTQTVTPDSGYDGLSEVTVNAMPTATQATPSISVSSSGLITASATQTAGYVSAGTKSATKQLTTQAAKTITPSTSSQTAVASGVYTTGAVTVAAIPSSYVKPTTTKTATTYTPTTSNQTIAAGTYCSGAQTIKGDSNLVAGNIKKGVSIFGVTGTHEGDGGGASVETCTVTFNTTYVTSTITLASATVYRDGNISVEYLENAMASSTITSHTFTNVLCGSAVVVHVALSGGSYILGTSCDNATVLSRVSSNFCIEAPLEPDSIGTVTLYDND